MENDELGKLKQKVCQITGVSQEEIESKSRKREVVIAKTLYLNEATNLTLNNKQLSDSVNLTMPSFWVALKRYSNFYKHNKAFRHMADKLQEEMRCSK